MYTEYVFENREYDVALRDVKSILFDVVMSEQSKVTAIIGKVQSTGDTKLQEKLINLCNEQGECLHSLLDISNSFKEHLQKLDSYSRELKRIEQKNIANIITDMRKKENKRESSPVETQENALMEELNKKQQELEAKQRELIEREQEAERRMLEAEALVSQQNNTVEQSEVAKEPIEEKSVTEEAPSVPIIEKNEPVEEKNITEDEPVEEKAETTNIESPRASNPTEESKELPEDTVKAADALGIKLPKNISGNGPLKFVSSAQAEGEEETKEESVEENQETKNEENTETETPPVEETAIEDSNGPVIQAVEEVTTEEPVIKSTEEVTEDTNKKEEVSEPVIPVEETAEETSENKEETEVVSEPVIPPVIETTEEVTEDTNEKEAVSEPVIPVVETTEETSEDKEETETVSEPVIPPVIETTEEVTEDKNETEAVSEPVIPIIETSEENTEKTTETSSNEEQPIQTEEAEEQVIKFKKENQDQTKAILTSAVQINKLRNSRFSQEAILNTKGFFGNSSDVVAIPQIDIPAIQNEVEQTEATTENKEELEQQLMENNLLPNDVDSIQNQINEKMEQAKQFYEEGKTDEAQKLYEEISDLNKQLQATQQNEPTLVKAA